MTHLDSVRSADPSANDLQNCRLIYEPLGLHRGVSDVFDLLGHCATLEGSLYRRFGIACWSHIQGSTCRNL